MFYGRVYYFSSNFTRGSRSVTIFSNLQGMIVIIQVEDETPFSIRSSSPSFGFGKLDLNHRKIGCYLTIINNKGLFLLIF